MGTVVDLCVCFWSQGQRGARGGGPAAFSRGQSAPPVCLSVSSHPHRQDAVAGQLLLQEPADAHIQVTLFTCLFTWLSAYLLICLTAHLTVYLSVSAGVHQTLLVRRFCGPWVQAVGTSAAFRWRQLTPGQYTQTHASSPPL